MRTWICCSKFNLFMHKECTFFVRMKGLWTGMYWFVLVCTVDYKHLPEIENCSIRLIRSPAGVICKCIALKLTQIIQTLQNQRARKHNVTFLPFLFFLLCLSLSVSLSNINRWFHINSLSFCFSTFFVRFAHHILFFLSESPLWLNPMQLAQHATV